MVIPSQVNYYGTIFPVSDISREAFKGCKTLTSVTIPNSVTHIYACAFEGCSGLTSITIPNSVKYIDYGTFKGCKRLKSIVIPNSVTVIFGFAFEGCSGLTSVTIGTSVSEIHEYAFIDCTGLTKIICKAVTPPTFPYTRGISNTYGQAFFDFYKPTLYVPAESIENYKNARWWDRFVKIRAIE